MTRIIASILVLLLFSSGMAEERDEGEVVSVKRTDPDMVKAIEEARSTLDQFLEIYRKPREGMYDFKLKVLISDEYGNEHFWVIPFKEVGKGFVGILANEPKVIKSVEHGQEIEFSRSDITDWGYTQNGKQFGSYTICVLFKRIPKEQADYYRKKHGFQC